VPTMPSIPPTATILNVKVHALTTAQTLALIEEFIASGQPHQLVTVNPEFVIEAQYDQEFRQIINNAALALPDGIGLLKAARFLKTTPLPERVPGSSLVVRLAELSHQKGYRLYFLGAQEGVAEKAVEKLKARYPKLNVAGCYAGSPTSVSGPPGPTFFSSPTARPNRISGLLAIFNDYKFLFAWGWVALSTSLLARRNGRRCGCNVWTWSGCIV
jgi:hypothetical protein